MAVKYYKPTTPARRGMSTQDTSMLTKQAPSKKLKTIKKTKSGRNNQGRITVRHRGGGAKRFYRHVNFSLEPGITAEVVSIEYDPNRSARIAKVVDQNGQFHYLLAGSSIKVGQKIESGDESSIEQGNRLTLGAMPVGSYIYCVEIKPGSGGTMVRSAGASAQLMSKEGNYCQVRLPSGEVRKFHVNCKATLGSVGNEQHQNIKLGSAGRRRRMGWRPAVRGKVMNAVDHPHGGGDGGAHSIGRHPKTPWGKPALGYKTRRRKSSNKLIVRSRHKAKRS